MHEMSIAQNLLEIIQENVPHSDGHTGGVKVVRLRIGEMAGVVPESLRFCFEAASQGTIAEGAELAIEEVPIMCRCRTCGSDFEVERFIFLCPKCQTPDVELLSGNELDVSELELVE